MSEMTPGEIVRRFAEHDRRIGDKVSRELYDRDRQEIKDDLSHMAMSLERLARSFEDYKQLETRKEAEAQGEQRVNRRTVAVLVVSAVLSVLGNLVTAIINVGGVP